MLVEAQVMRVIDGDTIEVGVGGKKTSVRIIGVDAPETNGPPLCYGQEASAEAAKLIERAGGRVLLERDVSETDRYGRLLRYVWLDHPDGRRMLNEELVKSGYAQVTTYPPDVKYEEMFLAAERIAKAERRGLWGACESFGAPLPTPIRPPRPTPTVPPIVDVPAPTARRGTEPTPDIPAPSGGLRYDPNGPDRDCGDFSTHDEAQRFFIAAGGPERDPHKLDRDSDGVACETLP